jgi:hypothetical protein
MVIHHPLNFLHDVLLQNQIEKTMERVFGNINVIEKRQMHREDNGKIFYDNNKRGNGLLSEINLTERQCRYFSVLMQTSFLIKGTNNDF